MPPYSEITKSLVFLNHQRAEVIVHAAHIASPLIEPAAGMIDRSCGISFPNELFDPKRVKLSPPLIKRNPESNAGIVIKLMHHADDVPLEALPRLLILSHEQFVMVVAQMSACCRKDRGQIGLKERLHGASAVYHILPDHHSDPFIISCQTTIPIRSQ